MIRQQDVISKCKITLQIVKMRVNLCGGENTNTSKGVQDKVRNTLSWQFLLLCWFQGLIKVRLIRLRQRFRFCFLNLAQLDLIVTVATLTVQTTVTHTHVRALGTIACNIQ